MGSPPSSVAAQSEGGGRSEMDGGRSAQAEAPRDPQRVFLGAERWALMTGEALAVLARLPSASVDAIITDPPYSSGGFTRSDRQQPVGRKYVQSGTKLRRPDFVGDSRDARSFRYWCALWMAECLRVAKPGAPICVFTDWRQLPMTTDAVQGGGWVWRGICVWDKTNSARPHVGRFAAQCEYVVWGSAGPMPARPEVGVLRGVIRERVEPREKLHMTGKPTSVMRALARICVPGGVILDPFAVSGTTGVGALLEGRRFVGIELTEEYARVADARLAACRIPPHGADSQIALFASTF